MKKIMSTLVLISLSGTILAQGPLSPPGAPGATMKTLDELNAAISQIQGEARTPISQAGTTITAPGSYILTTNLVSTGSGSGLTISADNVTVDLNGFSILCAGANGQGLAMGLRDNITIKNGTIRDAYYFGIAAYHTQNCRFENLIITGNGRAGSSYDGIHAGTNIFVTGCTITGNNSGIELDGPGCIVTGNRIINNGVDGIKLNSSGTQVCNNYCRGNGSNGNGAGIHITSSDNRIEGNTLLDNDAGLEVTSSGNFIVRNTASGNTDNYSLIGAQTIGPIVTATGTITNTNPWANFEY